MSGLVLFCFEWMDWSLYRYGKWLDMVVATHWRFNCTGWNVDVSVNYKLIEGVIHFPYQYQLVTYETMSLYIQPQNLFVQLVKNLLEPRYMICCQDLNGHMCWECMYCQIIAKTKIFSEKEFHMCVRMFIHHLEICLKLKD